MLGMIDHTIRVGITKEPESVGSESIEQVELKSR